jgi:hypothetical protein
MVSLELQSDEMRVLLVPMLNNGAGFLLPTNSVCF